MYNLKPDGIIEINFQGDDYKSIGDYMDSNDGITGLFPNSDSKLDWFTYLDTSNLLIQIWSLGFLLNELCNNENSFEENNGKHLFKIISENKSIIKKWFSDDGISLNSNFIDFIYGNYSNYGSDGILIRYNSEDEEVDYLPGEDLEFTNGAILKFCQNKLRWSDISDNVFIEKIHYDEFKSDLNNIKDSFR